MNKKLDKIVYGISSQENILLVKFFSRGLIIPGFLTIEGKDLKEYLATKAPLMLSEEEVSKITIDSASINKHTLSDQETILSYFDDYMEDIIDFFQYNVSIIRQILALITDLIPSNLNAKEKIISQEINRFSKMALFF